MIHEKEELLRLLTLLDHELSESLEAYLIGGANLIAQGIIQRETLDIDLVSPPSFSADVQKSVDVVANQEGLPAKWINTMPSMDYRFLELGWKERATLFFKGKRLHAFLLSRKDILGQKIAAAADRTKRDADDILAMNPTEEEWVFAHAWARKYDANPDWPTFIDKLVIELKERQRRD